ncbi:hypothetical protein [Micromonospora arida]
MPAPTGAHVMRHAIVTIDEVEYANQVTKVRLVPDTPVQTMRTLVPDGAVTDVDSTVWTLELSGLQIWIANGLAKALNDAAGTEIEVTIQPKVGTGQSTATCTIVAKPIEFGGEQGSFRSFEADFPVIGEPVWGVSA